MNGLQFQSQTFWAWGHNAAPGNHCDFHNFLSLTTSTTVVLKDFLQNENCAGPDGKKIMTWLPSKRIWSLMFHFTQNIQVRQQWRWACNLQPPDSHISTTANDQKPHVHSLISGAMSALPDNQSPSNRWHFAWGTTLLHSCSAVKNLYFIAFLFIQWCVFAPRLLGSERIQFWWTQRNKKLVNQLVSCLSSFFSLPDENECTFGLTSCTSREIIRQCNATQMMCTCYANSMPVNFTCTEAMACDGKLSPYNCSQSAVCVSQNKTNCHCVLRSPFSPETSETSGLVNSRKSKFCQTGNKRCVNVLGSARCEACPGGYTGDGWQCIDVDECLHGNPCPNHSTCTNSHGSFKCTCLAGYSMNGSLCQNVNECEITPHICPMNNSVCNDTDGGFLCSCLLGFTGAQCEDIDECLQNLCQANADCTNSLGSFLCHCQAGFIENGRDCIVDSGTTGTSFMTVDATMWTLTGYKTDNGNGEQHGHSKI